MLVTDYLSKLAKCHSAIKCHTLSIDWSLVLLDRQIILDAYTVNLGFELLWPHEIDAGWLNKQNLVLEYRQLFECFFQENADNLMITVFVILMPFDNSDVRWQSECSCYSLRNFLHWKGLFDSQPKLNIDYFIVFRWFYSSDWTLGYHKTSLMLLFPTTYSSNFY